MPKPSDATHRFFADPDVQHLRAQAAEDRALFVLFPGEVPMSRFLQWLLNPHEGHGLGDRGIKALLLALWGQDEWPPQASLAHLQPAQVAQSSFDNAFVLREFDLGVGRIDLLVVDPQHGCVIAIEHKFGAKLSAQQLQKYRQALERQWPDWRRVYVFLDSEDASADDRDRDAEHWFKLDYRWIRDLLRTQIERGRLGPAGQQTLAQFQAYLDDESAASALPQAELARGLRVAARHAGIVQRFAELQALGWSDLFARLRDPRADALLREYCQHWRLWDEVVALGRFAAFHAPLAERFQSDLWWQGARKVAYFALLPWRALDQDRADFPALWMRVRRHDDGRRVDLDAGLALERVTPEKRAGALDALEAVRKAFGLKKKAKDGARFVYLALRPNLEPGEAAASLVQLAADIGAAIDATIGARR